MGPLYYREGTTLTTLDFHLYLLFKNTFHDFLRRAPFIPRFIHKFLILIKIFRIFRYELTEKTDCRFNVFRISHFSPSIRNEKF